MHQQNAAIHHHGASQMRTAFEKHWVTILFAILTWVFVIGTRTERQDMSDKKVEKVEEALGITYVRKDVQEANERLLIQRIDQMDRKQEEFREQVLRRMTSIETELRDRRR